MRRLKNQWGDRNPTSGKVDAAELQHRADVRLMLWGVVAVVVIMALEIFL